MVEKSSNEIATVTSEQAPVEKTQQKPQNQIKWEEEQKATTELPACGSAGANNGQPLKDDLSNQSEATCKGTRFPEK